MTTASADSSPKSLATPTTADVAVALGEIWTADRQEAPVKIAGLPALKAFNGVLGITSDEKLVVIRNENEWSASEIDLPVIPTKLGGMNVLGSDGSYYMVTCEGSACDASAGTVEEVRDLNQCFAVDDDGAVWVLTEDCSAQYGGTAFETYPAPVQGLVKVKSLSPYVIPGIMTALTDEGVVYAWGEMDQYLPSCRSGATAIKLDSPPDLVRVQGLIATDSSGQMWTWLGVGDCSSDNTVSPVAGLTGPRNAEVTPGGILVSSDGKLWSVGEEFDSLVLTRGQIPPLEDISADYEIEGQRIMSVFKSTSAIFLVAVE